ncbi:MAG: hypothetical protein H6R12_2310, partial [Proteobacteria bacterium]|nr:hypothetical protein [Pseudomonadota bacterium]
MFHILVFSCGSPSATCALSVAGDAVVVVDVVGKGRVGEV